MVSDWPIRKLDDLCQSIDYGYTASAKDAPCGPKFLRITDIVSGHIDWDTVPYCEIDEATAPKFRLHHGDVVIARTGATTGYSVYIANPPDAVFASYLVRLKLAPKVNSRFISYFLKSPRFWGYIRGVLGDKSAQPNASARTMTQVTLALPPLENQQQAIACILGALDDKIELNRGTNETLEAMARAIFKSWFVDFEPVRAKGEGRQPSGMDAATAALFPDSFQDSPLGKIPKGWRVGKVSELVSLHRHGVNPGDFPNEVFHHYSIPAFDEGRWPRLEKGEEIKSNKFTVPEGAVMLSKLNPRIPRVWLTSAGNGHRALASTEFLVVLPTPGYGREFLYSMFNSDSFLAIFATLVTGTSGSHQRVKPESLLNIDVVIPKEALVRAYTRLAESFFQKFSLALEESLTLGALRDTLLPKLIFGDLQVPDAKRIVGRCA